MNRREFLTVATGAAVSLAVSSSVVGNTLSEKKARNKAKLLALVDAYIEGSKDYRRDFIENLDRQLRDCANPRVAGYMQGVRSALLEHFPIN